MIEEARFVPYHCEDVHRGGVLVLAPHADDEVIGCGGAIIRHRAAGNDVRIVVVTDDAIDANARRAECVRATAELGCDAPVFLGFPDRGLRHCRKELAGKVREQITTDTRAVYIPSPWEAHPDHFDVCISALAAIQRSNRELQIHCYEVSLPLAANVLLDVTHQLPAMEKALAHYGSQLAQRDYLRHLRALCAFRAYTLPSTVDFAEAYYTVSSTQAISVEVLFGHTRREEADYILE